MIRPSWNITYMEMCTVLAQRSTCIRIQTAAIIVKNNVIISVGYNGTPSGMIHCIDYFANQEIVDSYQHHLWSIENELHGEMNAILSAGRNGISLIGSTMYSIYSPCINCAKAIVSSGITIVYYKIVYKRDEKGINFLKKCGIDVIIIN